MEFIGRNLEIQELRNWGQQGNSSKISVLYGRRRVGKTRLIEEAFKGHPRFFKFEGLEGRSTSVQQKNFLSRLSELSGRAEYRYVKLSNWREILKLLSDYFGKTETILFFDEFQWMAAERMILVSDLKYVWDNYFSKNNLVHLILCGSISSFMVKKVIGSKALYGRIHLEIPLYPLTFDETSKMLEGLRSLREQLQYYLCLGGIPQYIELIDPTKSFILNLENHCLKKTGYLFKEFDRLFTSHFGKHPIYKKIILALSKKSFLSREEIKKLCQIKSGGTLSDYLEDLEMAGFIEKYTPVNKPDAKRLIRFRISDYYLLFYFKFIHPIQKKVIHSSKVLSLVQTLPDKKLEIWQGLTFEYFCYQHREQIASALGFGGIQYEAGPYFNRSSLNEGTQIDLVFYRADHVITVCEIKFQNQPIGTEVISDVDKKILLVPNPKANSIEKVLITFSQPTEALLSQGYFHRILMLKDIFKISPDKEPDRGI